MTGVMLTADETKSIEIALSSDTIQLEKVSVTASRRREKVLEAPGHLLHLWVLRKSETASHQVLQNT